MEEREFVLMSRTQGLESLRDTVPQYLKDSTELITLTPEQLKEVGCFLSILFGFPQLTFRGFGIITAGIGLSLVKELARLHGGNVGVTSKLGVGSTFFVWLPRGASHLPHDRIFESNDPGSAEAAAFRREGEMEDDQASATARWNSKTKGIDRSSILEVRYP